ncbi:MAG: hypothetical protein ACLFS5_01860 [Spirochaetaceae bacterium]
MALASYALVDWDTVKEQLNLEDSEESKAELVINAASETANDYAGRLLKADDYTHDFDGTGGRLLILRQYPVNAVDAVYVDSDRGFAASSEVTDFVVHANIGKIVRTSGVWPRGIQNIRVEYNAGYDPVPSQLQLAVLEVIAYNWRRLVSQSVGVRTMSGDGVSTEFELTIPTNAQRIFESYRVAPV